MRANITVKFYLKKTNQKEFHHKVCGRIMCNRKKNEFATDIFILQEEWNDNSHRCYKNTVVNQKLALIEADIYRIKEQLLLEGHSISSKLIKDVYFGRDKIRYGIVEFIDRFIEKKSKVETLSDSYKGKFKNIRRLVSLFVKKEHQTNDLMLSQIDYAFISSFDDFFTQPKIYSI